MISTFSNSTVLNCCSRDFQCWKSLCFCFWFSEILLSNPRCLRPPHQEMNLIACHVPSYVGAMFAGTQWSSRGFLLSTLFPYKGFQKWCTGLALPKHQFSNLETDRDPTPQQLTRTMISSPTFTRTEVPFYHSHALGLKCYWFNCKAKRGKKDKCYIYYILSLPAMRHILCNPIKYVSIHNTLLCMPVSLLFSPTKVHSKQG